MNIEFKNIKKWLDKFAGLYQNLLKSTADVRTGALKRSINSRVEGFSVVTSMLGYGENDYVWTPQDTPFNRLQDLYSKNSQGLMDAFMNDLKVNIIDNSKKLKNIK